MLQRTIRHRILEALSDTPVVLLNGARQTGKSTLAQSLAADRTGGVRYLTLDDAGVLSAAEADPDGFLSGLEAPVVIDEIQRVPDLLRAIKVRVDRNRVPGQFLLTGSADVLMLPNVSESLAGRMEIITLWPFSQGEIEGREEHFPDSLFADSLPSTGLEEDDLWQRVLAGGYPEVLARAGERRRSAWFQSYITTILQRDVRDIANIADLAALPRLLQLLAARAGQLTNLAEVSRTSGLPYATLNRYMTLLETTFLIQTLPAWSANISKRLVKSPKLLLADTGLACRLVDIRKTESIAAHPLAGPMLENFVAMEIRKQLTWADGDYSAFHFRTHTGQKVDIVLEDAGGRLVGIEVKTAASVRSSDFNGLRTLRDAAEGRMHRGVVLYAGREVVPFERDLFAVPVGALWRW